MSHYTVDRSEKEAVMKILVLGFCKFFLEGGANLAPADTQYFSKINLPATDRALMRGLQLSIAENEDWEADKDKDEDGDKDVGDSSETIHRQPRWPPNVEISGNCLRSVRIDNASRVNLQHDPYCLRKR